jgi:hypothetical protein
MSESDTAHGGNANGEWRMWERGVLCYKKAAVY